jgi:hypothetical protein
MSILTYAPGKRLVPLFDALGLDYKNNTIIFDLHRMASLDDELNGEAYKLVKRVVPKLEKGMES